MERLTQRPNGYKYALLTSELEEKFTAEQLVDILLVRLAEYEDTGYAPEEIKAMAAKINDLKKEAEPLIRARNEDRLDEHPCKVGDPVWVIDWCGKLYKGYSCPYGCSSGQRDRAFRKNCIRYCRIFRAYYCKSMLGEFGKTVFLTKMAAQRRLQKKAEETEGA